MNFFQLKKSLTQNIAPVYIIYGNDEYLVRHAVFLLHEKCVQLPEFNYLTFDMLKPTPDTFSRLISALSGVPLMSEKKLIVAESVNLSASDFKKHFDEYLKNPNPHTVFAIVIATNAQIPDVKKYQNTAIVNCDKGDSVTLKKWLASEFIKENVTIEPEAADLLLDYTLNSMSLLFGETQKLISYAKVSKTVTVKDIETLVSKDSEYRIYEFSDAAAKGDFENAYKILIELVNRGMPTQALLSRLTSHYSNLFTVSVSTLSDIQLAKKLKVKEYAVKMLRRQAKINGRKRLKNSLVFLTQTETDIKSGKTGAEQALFIALARTASGV